MSMDNTDSQANTARILRLPEIIKRTGLPRASIYQQMAQGIFPQQVPLGVRTVGWVESEVDSWISERIRARNG